MISLLMKGIQFVNNFGPVLTREQIKVDQSVLDKEKETIEFDFR